MLRRVRNPKQSERGLKEIEKAKHTQIERGDKREMGTAHSRARESHAPSLRHESDTKHARERRGTQISKYAEYMTREVFQRRTRRFVLWSRYEVIS